MIQEYQQFGNGGVWHDQLSDFEFKIVEKEALEIKKTFDQHVSVKSGLIGHVEHSFNLVESRNLIERKIFQCIRDYHEFYPFHYTNKTKSFAVKDIDEIDLKLDRLWINFQRKYDFQPIHDHLGVYSFIIFLNIPYNIEEEFKYGPGIDSVKPKNGTLEFHYSDFQGRISTMTIPADNSWHGRMILFPADLCHSVNPFYSSDEYRITISGNVTLEYKAR